MKEYGQLLAGDPAWAERARAFSARVRDVTEIVSELGAPRAPRACARDSRRVPRCLPSRARSGSPPAAARSPAVDPGVEILPFAEQEICCGSAGIYNLVEPETARELGDRKVAHIEAVSPDVIATANPGCTLQMTAAARRLGQVRPICHPIEILDASIRGVRLQQMTDD